MLSYPRVVIDLKKFRHNVTNMQKLCREQGIEVYPVLKGAGADRRLLEVLADMKVEYVCDSRIDNLKKAEDLPIKKILLRLPMLSIVDEVVKYSDISLNSEIVVIKALDEAAKKQNKIHKIILMIELGDLREGVLPKDVDEIVAQIMPLQNIKLCGVGVNLTCYGAVIPDTNNLGELCAVAERIEEKFNTKLEFISGGNSSSVPMLLKKNLPSKINMLRVGESIILGTESVLGTMVVDMVEDIFIIEAELIEYKDKNTSPTGEKGYDAFGVPYVEIPDRGIRKRGIVAMGRQDIPTSNLTPVDSNISIIGASSDHCILDLEDTNDKYKIGDIVSFKVGYSALLGAMTSPYVYKHYVE